MMKVSLLGHALSQHIGKIMRTGDPIRLDILDWRDVNKDHIEIVMDMIEVCLSSGVVVVDLQNFYHLFL